jgi:hypothetical protein
MKSEARIQQDAFTEIRNRHPETYGVIWHTPNGGIRDAVTATFMRGAGVVRGVQDLMLLWAGKCYPIEVKTPTGYCSTDQKLIHAVHAAQGFITYLFTTSEHIINFFETVISGGDISRFEPFISPYSNPELVNQYRTELREERKSKLKNVA